jgi:hypothetical protein
VRTAEVGLEQPDTPEISASQVGLPQSGPKHVGVPNWRKKVGFRPKLYIHTNHPKSIKNNGADWDVQFAPLEVDQEFINNCANRPAWFEKVTQAYCNNPTHEPDAFVLWVLDDRVINIADLAWWGDDQTNVMIDTDWKFILYQHAESYRSKFIKVSQAK